MDKKKLIAALKRLEDSLDEKDFDLEAWKSSAESLLTRTFGEGNARSQQVVSLKIDYSSWALRDAPSTYQPLESCKKKGREILRSAAEEIEIFGMPGQVSIMKVLGEVYSEAEMQQIESMASNSKKDKELKKVLDKAGKEKSISVLLRLLKYSG